ncbi:MAG: cupin protein [Acidimicrobiales bacterium]|nr:cupin protein [Acidimicrobiales bacterium]
MQTPITEMPIEMQVGEIETRAAAGDEMLTRHIQLPAGTDFTPLFEGLPGNLCQCPHWGYVIAGSIRLRYADGTEEVSSAGDVYHWPAGHTGWTDEGVTFLEFSPTSEIQPVLEHLAGKMAAAG